MSSSSRPRICYYEILGITITADADEIKRAFRRAALEWHPDKNAHRVEEATEHFKLIQAAHAVISDDNERAWYDAHRDDILSGGNGSGGGGGGQGSESGSSNLVNIFAYFNASAFGAFNDLPGGFYAVYRGVFAAIAAEEARYTPRDAPAMLPLPIFNGPAVEAFYEAWSNFSSRMSFSWADVTNPNEAPNRVERRFIEKENEAARRSARKERNEQVRALVAFVRKRDGRLVAIAANARKAALEAASERVSRDAAIAASRRAARVAARAAAAIAADEQEAEFADAYRLADEDDKGGVAAAAARRRARMVAAAAAAAADGGVIDGSSPRHDDLIDEETTEIFDCTACGKAFKSAAAFENHEKSKRHLAAVAALAGVMAIGKDMGDGEEESDFSDEDEESENEEESEEEEEDDADIKNVVEIVGSTNVDSIVADVTSQLATTSLSGRGGGGGRSGGGNGGFDSDSSNEVLQKRKPNKTELRKAARVAARAPLPGGAPRLKAEVDPNVELRRLDPTKTRGGASGVPLAAFIASHDGLSLRRGAEARMDDLIGSHVCETCGEVAGSRNALFLHLKRSGHEFPVGAGDAPSRGKAKRKAKKITAVDSD